jgi:hypothetical protein
MMKIKKKYVTIADVLAEIRTQNIPTTTLRALPVDQNCSVVLLYEEQHRVPTMKRPGVSYRVSPMKRLDFIVQCVHNEVP